MEDLCNFSSSFFLTRIIKCARHCNSLLLYILFEIEIQILKNRSTCLLFYKLSSLSLDPEGGTESSVSDPYSFDTDPDSEHGCGSGSTDLIESGSNTDPDPKYWQKVWDTGNCRIFQTFFLPLQVCGSLAPPWK
jgi:hypothetical protein